MTPQDRIAHMTLGLVEARQQNRLFAPDATLQDLSPEEAYAVQAGVARALGWFADRPRAWKAGGAPVVSGAPLPQVLHSPAVWSPVSTTATDATDAAQTWIVEAELAFTLARAPQGADVAQALGTVAVSIEAIDTRLASGLAGAPSAWKLADQGVHGTLVLGDAQAAAQFVARSPADWATQAWSITVNGELAQRAQGGLPAIDPLTAVRWLAVHAAVHTGGLQASDVVTTGAWGLVRARRGDVVEVRFDGVGAAQVTLGH